MDNLKKSYSFKSNLSYVIKTTEQWEPRTFLLYFFSILCGVLVPTITAFTPSVLLFMVEKNYSPESVLIFVFVILIMSFGLTLLDKHLNRESQIKISNTTKHFDVLFIKKLISMDFEFIEGPLGRTKFTKAKNSLKQSGVYDFVGNTINVIIQILGLISMCGIISALNPFVFLTIVFVQVILLLISLAEQTYINKGKDERALIDRHLNEISRSARDFIAAKDIRFYSMHNCLKQISEYYIKQKKEKQDKMYYIFFITDMARQLLSLVVTGGTYFFLFYILFKDGLSVAEFNLYLTSVLSFDLWLSKLARAIDVAQISNHCVSDMREFLEFNNETKNNNSLELPFSQTPQDIEINNLCFRYKGADKDILSNINLKIKAGEKIAIVGMNGAGKTTLVKLICNLYACQNGEITLNGNNISCYDKKSCYRLFSVVFQDANFLPVSIASNISNLPLDATDFNKIDEVLCLSGLEEKINSLKESYNTKLIKSMNEDAIELSGGEFQKLLLARALYKDSPYVILDEPTASLDPISENNLYMKYNELINNKTAIFISHRLSSTRFCDRIILLDDGKIAEVGTHDELMSKNGKYSKMYKIQSEYYG